MPEGLPLSPPGTAGALCVAGPRAISISTAVRAAHDRLLYALAHRRWRDAPDVDRDRLIRSELGALVGVRL